MRLHQGGCRIDDDDFLVLLQCQSDFVLAGDPDETRERDMLDCRAAPSLS
jgi:hypothetical protein